VCLDLSVVDIENAVGSRLALVELGLAEPIEIAGRYRLLRLLGRGARGVVCRARDTHLHREVALKLYPSYEPGAVAQEVASEAQALARLKHANVVGVYDFGDAHLALEGGDLGRMGDRRSIPIPIPIPCFFMSMEYVRGQSLRRWLAGAQPGHDPVLAVFAQIGEGLAHAHEAGVVHRDVKPDNVMLDETGRVLVVDFGLASRRAGTVTAMTSALVRWQPPTIAGTYEYMAPEARIGQANAASDQYSFAVSLHEALIGSLPPLTSDGIACIDVGRFPGALARVLERALAFEATHRYPSMRALLDQLPRRWDEQWRWTTLTNEAPPRRRRPWLIWGLGASVVVGGVGGWFASTLSADSPDSPDSSGPSGARSSECPAAALAGRWQLESVPLWTYNWGYRNRRGRYDLVIERRGTEGCDIEAQLSKTGSSRGSFDSSFVGRVPVTVSDPDARGVFELLGDWTIRDSGGDDQHVAFNLFIDGDSIRGDFRRFVTPRDGIERPGLIGVARGVRLGGRLPSVEAVDDVPCRSQCNMVCAGDEATRRCRTTLCLNPERSIDSCGPPSSDFEQPYTTSTKMIEGGIWTPSTNPSQCVSRIAAVIGEWTVWGRLADDTRSWSITLAADGCELYGTARSLDDSEARAHALAGEVDAEGRWLVYDRDHPDALRWAMMGWEFAFGSAGGDHPGSVVARKRRQNGVRGAK